MSPCVMLPTWSAGLQGVRILPAVVRGKDWVRVCREGRLGVSCRPMKPPFGLTRRDAPMLAAVVLAAVVFFAPFLFSGKIFLAADTLYTVFPWRAWAPEGFRPHNSLITDPVNHNYAELYNRQLKAGELQDWNPYLLGGIPATGATAMSGMSGPLVPAEAAAPPPAADPGRPDLAAVHPHLLMGVSMYLFLREIGAGPPALPLRRRGLHVQRLRHGLAGVREHRGQLAAYLRFLLICLERLRLRRAPLDSRLRRRPGAGDHLPHGAPPVHGLHRPAHGRLSALRPGPRVAGGAAGATSGPRWPAFGVICAWAASSAGSNFCRCWNCSGTAAGSGAPSPSTPTSSPWAGSPGAGCVTLVFPDWFGSPPLRFNLVPATPGQEYMNYCELALYVGVPMLFLLLAAFAVPGNGHRRFCLGGDRPDRRC